MKLLALASVGAALLTACVGDLNTLPLNKNENISEFVYGTDEGAYLQGLTRIYFQFIDSDKGDLQINDGGEAELIRAFFCTQEVTADGCKVAWGKDEWTRDLNANTWSEAQNNATYGVYVRSLIGITCANEYLRQTASDKLASRGVSEDLVAKIQGYRAEARFLRAYLYWMLLDTFGNPPFSTEDSAFGGDNNPKQISREFVFNYCVGELEALLAADSDMPEARTMYPRADKGSVAGLLARMYLNAEVYTGKAMWAEAKAVCEKIFGMGYELCPDYAALFRGDNGDNPKAKQEMLWAVAYDSEFSQSWGGTTLLTIGASNSTESAELQLNGVSGGWEGPRVPYKYVQTYFAPSEVSAKDDKGAYAENEYKIADKRGQVFYIKGRYESMSNEDELYSFYNGWTCFKYNNIPHDMTAAEFSEQAKLETLSDIDFPMIRLGEIYLIYAEACMHVGGDATTQLAALAARAGVAAKTQADVTEEWLMAERARELMWECHRRTDLIRYGQYGGEQATYNWTYKGGQPNGTKFSEHLNIFAIPATEMSANTDLIQNPGYKTVR